MEPLTRGFGTVLSVITIHKSAHIIYIRLEKHMNILVKGLQIETEVGILFLE